MKREFEREDKEVKIVIDKRESELFDFYFDGWKANVVRRVLKVGDFLCSEKLVVERKSKEDFERSIVDGRLFTQLKNLKLNYPSIVLVVEGDEEEGRIGRAALLGAYATVISDFGTSLFFTKDIESTAEIVFALAKHEQLAKKHPVRIFAKRKTLTLSQTQRAIIEAFPMIGPHLAQSLLLYFGNIKNITNASEKELLAVRGLGKKRAKVLSSLFHYSYDSDEDNLFE